MTYAWKDAEGQWIEIDRERRLPGHTIEGLVDDWGVTPAAVAALTVEQRAERGYVEVVETAPPTGVRIVGSKVEGSSPTRIWLTEAYAPEELAQIRADRVAEIKAEARRRIVAVMDKDQQDNALALGQEMIYTHGLDPSTWPAEDRATYEGVMEKWSAIKAIRSASDLIEADLPTSPADLCAFVAATAAGWPA